ncbi:MAG: GHKL domain-containing protein [Bacteroidetes bacterium]|nr:GHKL domain-containing protein [Bacteroidota bacterium]
MSSTKKNNTFRFPFDINPMVFIVLAVLFFILSIKQVSDFLMPKVNVSILSEKIQQDAHAKINKFNHMFENKTVFEHAIQNSLTPSQHEYLMNLALKFHLYDNEKLVFWNDNYLSAIHDSLPERTPKYYKSKNGHYLLYAIRWGDANRYKAVLTIPVKSENLFQSDYMKNYFFVYPDENDFGIRITADSVKKSIPVKWIHKPLFYLRATEDYFSQTDNNVYHLIFNALTFIFFGISIHTYFKVIVKKKKPLMVFLWLLFSAITLRALTYIIGFPNNFSEYKLFSPEYFASNYINKSIGDVFINVCLCFWILLFFAVNVQGKITSVKHQSYKVIFGLIALVVSTLLHFYFINLIYSIVLDSVINFDATLISRFTIFSFIGLLSFLVIFANLVLISFISNNYANACFPKKIFKYGIYLFVTVVYAVVAHNEHNISYLSYFLWVSSVCYILDFSSSKIRFDFNSIYLLVWIVMVSFFGSYLLTQLNIKKEEINRKKFAENIIKEKDIQLENKLASFKNKIEYDETLQLKLSLDSEVNYNAISDYIYIKYFDSYLNKYKIKLDIYNRNGHNINSVDTLTLNTFIHQFSPSNCIEADSQIYFKKEHQDYYYYLVCPIIYRGVLQGTIVYTLYETLSVFDENNTDFIVYGGLKSEFKEYKYSMAIYEEGRIYTRKGFYSFQSSIDPQKLFEKNRLLFVEKGDQSEMWYHFANKKSTVLIVKKSNKWIMLSTLFAYNFLIYFGVISLYILGNIIARSNLNTKRFFNLLSLNLRLKIQLSILFVVFTSFMVIGYLTSRYLSDRIKEKARVEISDYAQLIQNELAQFNWNNNKDTIAWEGKKIKTNLVGNIDELSKRFDVNLSLFDIENGSLLYSSQPDLFQSGVLSNLMPHNTFYELKNNNKEHVINPENIGNFNYIVSYSFLKDSIGKYTAILQLPYIFSNFEITSETNSVIVTIVNMYVFVFLISSLLALFISNSVSRPFKFIVKQFTQINLSKTNEPLKWNNSDEIGMLVKEYNRMLRKLENSTVLLAKNEREMAWREMAKQVAHEIKNPLTPMKLSLQMLERAIKNNNPNVAEMTSRVTKTIIEQIDNLTIIATNFSSFAKLPEIKKEIIVLNEVLYSVTGMYNDGAQFEYLFLIPDYPIHIYADKGQLIRVFTNIIQNAIQAIPEGNKGYISLLVSKINNNFVRISISDNGEGISKEKGKKLFQPYFTTKSSGTGLGLAMCRDIVEQFEGKIEYESVINEGTTFHIDLPVIEIESVEEDTRGI